MSKSTPRPRRANGEGSLTYDEKRDRWRGAVSWLEPDGTLHRKAFAGPRQADVRSRMANLQRELDAGRKPATKVTVGAYLAEWLEAERARVRPSTWQYRESHCRCYIVPELGQVKLAFLQPRHVEQLTAGLIERGLSPRTAVGTRTTLRKALGDAVRDGMVGRNVAALARPPRVPGREVEYLTRDEMRRLLKACADDRLGPLITLAAATGLRQGEVLGLGWADVDLDAGTLTVRRSLARSWREPGWELAEPKTVRSRRTIHLPDQAVEALRARRDQQGADREAAGADWQDMHSLAFTDSIGRPMMGWRVTHDFHDLLDRAGIRSIPFHALRHSWATLALASGVPLKVVADNLGHSSIAVTAQFYSGIVPEMGRDAADAVGRALSDV